MYYHYLIIFCVLLVKGVKKWPYEHKEKSIKWLSDLRRMNILSRLQFQILQGLLPSRYTQWSLKAILKDVLGYFDPSKGD